MVERMYSLHMFTSCCTARTILLRLRRWPSVCSKALGALRSVFNEKNLLIPQEFQGWIFVGKTWFW